MTETNGPSAVTAHDDLTTFKGQPVAIRPLSGPTAPPLAKPAGNTGGYPRPFANERRNSRVETALPRGNWQILWQADLENQMGPSFVLQEAERILVRGTHQWLLFANDGTLLHQGGIEGGEASFDGAHDLFYAASPSGMILAYHAQDGAIAFKTNGYGSTNNTPTLLVRRGTLLLDVSPGASVQPRAQTQIDTGIQVQDVGDPPQVNESGVLLSAVTRASTPRETFRLPSAMQENTLVLALKDRIQLVDLHLKIQAELTGDFEPLAMSLDETGRLYLIVMSEGGRNLWVITPKGERVLSMRLPPQTVSTPPIVGYDHRIYLTEGGRLLAISPEGKTLWENPLAGHVGGAIVTTDDQLIVAVGTQVISFDAAGKGTVLHSFEGEQLQTPPVLTAHGELLVASATKLYCLGVAPR
jgi:hypothetical protein